MKPYRTLVFAEILQETPLTVGGTTPHGMVDAPLARDGRGRPVLRGTSLAGAFLQQARNFWGDLPQSLTADHPGRSQEQTLQPSLWRFAHAHPTTADRTLFLQHVSIDPQTQAAKDDHLFNLEALPAGTRWGMHLEMVPDRDLDLPQLERLAAPVLAAWANPGGIRLGRGTRHGYGWCHLQRVQVVRLDSRHIRLWPNALHYRSHQEWLALFQDQDAPVEDLLTFLERVPVPSDHRPRRVSLPLSGSLLVGVRSDDFGAGYGLDSLSLGGHAQLHLHADNIQDRVIRALPHDPGMTTRPSWAWEDFKPDFHIAAMPNIEQHWVPCIPGSSIRGVWRSALGRHLKAQGEDPYLFQALFGSNEQAGSLSVATAFPKDDDWQLIWQQHVAVDEFSGGTFGSAKFDRISLAAGSFVWRAEIASANYEEAQQQAALLQKLLDRLGSTGFLSLGGGVFRGHGHPRWTLDPLPWQRTSV